MSMSGCGLRTGVFALAALAGAGCDAGPDSISPGRYAYVASHATPRGDDTIRLEGVLEVQSVGADSIEGEWEVPDLHPELRVRSDGSGRSVVTAHPTYFGTLHHRLRRIGGGISCSGAYVWVGEDGAEQSTKLSCSITPLPAGQTRPAAP
jgi:hypothetical protein